MNEKRRLRYERLHNRTNPPERPMNRREARLVMKAAKKKGRK